jgi:hypothetical protein
MSCADFVIITLGDGYLSTKVVSEEELKERLKRTTDS